MSNAPPPRTMSAPLNKPAVRGRGGGAPGGYPGPHHGHHGHHHHHHHHHHGHHHHHMGHHGGHHHHGGYGGGGYPPGGYPSYGGYPGGHHHGGYNDPNQGQFANPTPSYAGGGLARRGLPAKDQKDESASEPVQQSPNTQSPEPQPAQPAAPAAAAAPATETAPETPVEREPSPPETPEPTFEEFPEDCIYDFGVFKMLRRSTSELTPIIREWTDTANLWDKVPGGRPDHMWNRDDMFSDKAGKAVSKVIKDRTLAHQVRGILTRLAPEKYDVLLGELLALPIRQSTEEEISEVVQTMYTKAVNPAEAIYVEWYIKMIVELVEYTNQKGADGQTQLVGKSMRKAIVDRCQQEFEKDFSLGSETHDEDGRELTFEEKETAVSNNIMTKAKFKANIVFLGHLFVNKLVLEKVVNIVLYKLIYGDTQRHKKRNPETYELEMFNALLRKVGPHLSKDVTDKYVTQYMKSVEQLSRTHKEKRIQFMMMDLYEYWQNGWEVKGRRSDTKGPMKLKDFETHQLNKAREANEELARAPVRTAPRVVAQPQVAKKPEINAEELKKQFQGAMSEGNVKDASDIVKRAKEFRAEVMMPWLKRVLATVKLAKEREHVGENLQSFLNDNSMSQQDVQSLMRLVAENLVEEVDDNPKLFISWATMIEKGAPTLHAELHTLFLNVMINSDPPTSVDTMVRFIREVNETCGSSLLAVKPGDFRRFRILPSVLAHTLPHIRDDEYMEEGADTELIEALDAANVNDPETTFFQMLCDGAQGKELSQAYNGHPEKVEHGFIMKVVCAVFTYVRWDDGKTEVDKCADLFKTIHQRTTERDKLEQTILMEAFMTYKDLDRRPNTSIVRFVQWLASNKIVTREGLDAYKASLSRPWHGNDGKAVATMLDNVRV